MKTAVFNLDFGVALLQWPSQLSSHDRDDLAELFDLLARNVRRKPTVKVVLQSATIDASAGKQDECQQNSNVAVPGTDESLDNHK